MLMLRLAQHEAFNGYILIRNLTLSLSKGGASASFLPLSAP